MDSGGVKPIASKLINTICFALKTQEKVLQLSKIL